MAVASQYAFTGRLVQMLAEVTARGRRRFASAPAMPRDPLEAFAERTRTSDGSRKTGPAGDRICGAG